MKDKAIGLKTLKYVRNFGYLSNLQLMTIGGFHAFSGDTNNNGEMNKCWWTNKAS